MRARPRGRASRWSGRAGAAVMASAAAHTVVALAAGAILWRSGPISRQAPETIDVDVAVAAPVAAAPVGATSDDRAVAVAAALPAIRRSAHRRVFGAPLRVPPAESPAASARFALTAATVATGPGVAAAPSVSAAPRPALSAGGRAGVSDGGEAFGEADVSAPARLLSSAPVVYPAAARAAEIEVDLPIEIVVGTDGRVSAARPLMRGGYGLDEAALQALRAYRFSPARRDGRPVPVRMRWTIQFHLR
jgi:TonB family protein